MLIEIDKLSRFVISGQVKLFAYLTLFTKSLTTLKFLKWCAVKLNEIQSRNYILLIDLIDWLIDLIDLIDWLFSSAEEEMMPGKTEYRATIYPSGTVYYNFPTVLQSACLVNVLYFPMDTQICTLKFGSWSHSGSELDLYPSTDQGRPISK